MRDVFNIQIAGYDDRAQLETLSNVKYYITRSKDSKTIPYGFDYDCTIDGFKVYINSYYLPFGYTYENSISYDEWNKLSMLEKQESMLTQVTVEDALIPSDSIDNIVQIPFSIIPGDGVEVKDKEIIIRNKNDSIILKFESPIDIEQHLSFTGLKHNDIFNIVEDDTTNSTIRVNSSNGALSSFLIKTKSNRYNYAKTDFVCFLGHNEEPVKEIEINFSLPGSYTFESIAVSVVNMDDYKKKIDNLSNEVLSNVNLDNNTISGDISLNSNKYLLLSVPYSKGWKAYVDGKQVPLLRANEHYMAVYLEKGYHHIEMKYITPGIIVGSIISGLSVVCFVGLVIIYRRSARQKRKPGLLSKT